MICIYMYVCMYVSIYDLYMSICMCDVYACLCISFGLKKLIGTIHGKYNHPICVDNNTTFVLLRMHQMERQQLASSMKVGEW